MNAISDGIRILDSSPGILVVAPHGPLINGRYENDARTGIIAEELHHQLGCTAIINDRFFKPKGPVKKSAEDYFLDLYRVDHSEKVAGYIDAIRRVAEHYEKTLVIWVHGIFDQFARDRAREHAELNLFSGPADTLDALLAFGQGPDPKTCDPNDRFTARQETIDRFLDQLNRNGMMTIPTHRTCNNYRGRDAKRFNQWFLNNGYTHDQVESLQLEIKETGFRDSRDAALATAGIIAQSIQEIV